MDGKGFVPGGIDDILRKLQPKGMVVPPALENGQQPLEDVEGGGIDRILAELKPRQQAKPVNEENAKDTAFTPGAQQKVASSADVEGNVAPVGAENAQQATAPASAAPSTTKSLRRGLENMVIPDASSSALDSLGPKARLDRLRDIEHAKHKISKEQKELDRALQREKEKLAELEEKAEAKKAANKAEEA